MAELRLILGALTTVLGGAVLAFWGWVAVRTVDQGRKIADLEARMNSNDNLHAELLVWLRSMDCKLSGVAEALAGLKEAFKHYGIERRIVEQEKESGR